MVINCSRCVCSLYAWVPDLNFYFSSLTYFRPDQPDVSKPCVGASLPVLISRHERSCDFSGTSARAIHGFPRPYSGVAGFFLASGKVLVHSALRETLSDICAVFILYHLLIKMLVALSHLGYSGYSYTGNAMSSTDDKSRPI